MMFLPVMAKTNAHSKILEKAAGEILTPLGVFQKGRSRTWIDDQGWWIGLIEFQPSSWSKGSYLNVGAMWLWNEKDYFSFDVGYRVAHHVPYENDDQVGSESLRLARLAADEIVKYRTMFPSIDSAAAYLREHVNAGNQWSLFNAAVACAYVGDTCGSTGHFGKLMQLSADFPWQKDLQRRASQLATEVRDNQAFRRSIEESIASTRQLLKLPQNERVAHTSTRTETPSSSTP
jgi:hypothetical protein